MPVPCYLKPTPAVRSVLLPFGADSFPLMSRSIQLLSVKHWQMSTQWRGGSYSYGDTLRFIPRTDHSAVRSILSARFSGHAGARVARWQSRLVPYSYTVEYVPRHKLPDANALSRLPDPSGVASNNQADEELLVIAQVVGPGNLILDHV